MEKIFCSVPEAASALGVGRSMIYELMKSGELESTNIRSRRLIPVEGVKAYGQALRRAA